MSCFVAYLNDEGLLFLFVLIGSIDSVFYEIELFLKTIKFSSHDIVLLVTTTSRL